MSGSIRPQTDVVEYNLALAGELARAGVDEIQFDYVRFPTNGWRGDWQGDLEATALRRREVVSSFLAAARDTLDPYRVKISADLYGIMAWGRIEDLALTGPARADHRRSGGRDLSHDLPLALRARLRGPPPARRRSRVFHRRGHPAVSWKWWPGRPRSDPGCRPSPTG